jgi:hypothetical protein
MSASPDPKTDGDLVPVVGGGLLLLLALCFGAALLFSVSAPAFAAVIFFGLSAVLTPLVTGGLLYALRHSKHRSWMHRVVFYSSATLLALWSFVVVIELCF